MKAIDFWFDPISPYALLAFERLPQALEGLSYSVTYRPILFAALLKHWGHKGPAEIEPKRVWIFRHVHWLASQNGIALQMPSQHPFNPLALLRLAYACAGPGGVPNRYVCTAIFDYVWKSGADANDPSRLEKLGRQLMPRLDPTAEEVKHVLRDATATALTRGVFGVPTFAVEGQLFWGLDSLEMLAAYLRGNAWFAENGSWQRAGAPHPGVQRTE